ncbi:MAG: sterol desaturase family protein [Planctomycetes bacterium]|nr:sterol desaturase family protein [Planctomycetota bacterium]
MIVCEMLRPGRRWPKVATWWFRAGLLNGVQVGVVYLSGLLWDDWMRENRPWSADALGQTGSIIVGYLAITFIYYWWHRLRHDLGWLWRIFHQVHHSPQRIEVITSFYKHPLEILANGVLSSAILYLLVGVSPQAAAMVVLITGLAELFYHWNVPTPYWLGFLIQRPESHCVHHQEGLHSYNYADLPIWDMLFGTFKNPKRWQSRCGFGEKEHELLPMLLLADVNKPSPPKSPPSKT